MRSFSKKSISLFLAVLMAFSFVITAFAAPKAASLPIRPDFNGFDENGGRVYSIGGYSIDFDFDKAEETTLKNLDKIFHVISADEITKIVQEEQKDEDGKPALDNSGKPIVKPVKVPVLGSDNKPIVKINEAELIMVNTALVMGLTVNFNAVSDEAFKYSKSSELEYLEYVTELKICSDIKSIGNEAFANLPNLRKVTFEAVSAADGATVIGDRAFANCPKLESVTFNCDVELGKSVFAGSDKLTSVTFDNDAKLDKEAFVGCNTLENLTFKGEAEIGKEAFKDCTALTKIAFTGDTVIEKDAFKGCTALKTITAPETAYFDVTPGALNDTPYFKGYDVDFVTLGGTLLQYRGADKEVVIPLNVTAIGKEAFKNNSALESIRITKFVDTLGDEAFMSCTSLREVIFSNFGEIKNIGTDVFTNTPYFDEFEGDFFTVGTYLIKYLGDDAYVTIPNTITRIAPNCFEGCYETTANGGHSYVISGIFVSASVVDFGANCFGLEKLNDGSYYTPRIHAYSKTANDSMGLLKAAGYNPTVMPAPADVDADGQVSAADARMALRMSVKLDVGVEPIIYRAANINGDNKVTADDARSILRLSVGLENYTAEDLLYMPATDFEILQAYTVAMKTIAKYTAGYTKSITNTPGAYDMSTKGKLYLLDDLQERGYENSTTKYDADTKQALDNIEFCDLISTKNIKNASCVLDVDDNYVITINFKDMLDNNGTSDVTKVFPVKTREFFADMFNDEYWWNSKYDIDKITKFDLTYTNPTVTVVMEKDTSKVLDCELAVGYHFDIAGKINALPVSAKGNHDKPATFDRLDIVKYSDFVY